MAKQDWDPRTLKILRKIQTQIGKLYAVSTSYMFDYLVQNRIFEVKTNVTARRQPFSLTFDSDSYEFKEEVKVADMGFKLAYIQSSTNC